MAEKDRTGNGKNKTEFELDEFIEKTVSEMKESSFPDKELEEQIRIFIGDHK